MDKEIWKYPLAKRNIKKAIMDAISESNENFEYVIDRIGYHLTTNTNAIHELDYINKAVDIIKEQNLSMFTTMRIFDYVAMTIQISQDSYENKKNQSNKISVAGATDVSKLKYFQGKHQQFGRQI